MKDVEYIIGSENISRTPLNAYSSEALDFINNLSSRIMKSPLIRAYPDLAALGFWCRKGNIQKLKENCPEAEYRLGRGLCFHIAPSNIPMSFAFSYIFGILSGCSNIVRLPSKKFVQTEACLELIGSVLKDHPEIESRSVFVRYPVDNEITEYFSQMADCRMIWGGDNTVNNIRALKISPKCIDIAFADRFSICVLDGDSINNTEDIRLTRLAEDFYNDTYLMDQNACSSPKIICWINDSEEARNKFWSEVYSVAQKKYELQAAVCVDKYTKACEDSIDDSDNISSITHEDNLLYRVELKSLIPGCDKYRGKGGYFYECALESLDDIAPVVTEKYQTVTYYGIDPNELRNVVIRNRLRGIDRITPIGKAMDIGVIWDGYDLVRTLSRIVNVE